MELKITTITHQRPQQLILQVGIPKAIFLLVLEIIPKGFIYANVYFFILGKSHSNTSSNSSLNRLESPSNDLVRAEHLVYVDEKSQMRSNQLLDSPQSTSSSQSNLSNNEYNFTQVFKSNFNMRRIMKIQL